jgi:hypothetical protein
LPVVCAYAFVLLTALLALDPAKTMSGSSGEQPLSDAPGAEGETPAEVPKGGAGVSPVELIPRLELRQSFAAPGGGVSLHDTTAELDIQFVGRVLLRYEGTVRVLGAPSGQKSGFGDARIQALTVLASSPTFVAALITGAVLDTASQPELGAGKQQIVLGGGAAIKPTRWSLPYLVVFEQFSVGGKPERASVNQLVINPGGILFGRGYTWYKLDLNTVVDFEKDAASLFGMIEVGRLLVGRIGLFMRAGTQFLGPQQLDYSLGIGVRYLFRLGRD